MILLVLKPRFKLIIDVVTDHWSDLPSYCCFQVLSRVIYILEVLANMEPNTHVMGVYYTLFQFIE